MVRGWNCDALEWVKVFLVILGDTLVLRPLRREEGGLKGGLKGTWRMEDGGGFRDLEGRAPAAKKKMGRCA